MENERVGQWGQANTVFVLAGTRVPVLMPLMLTASTTICVCDSGCGSGSGSG